MIDIKKVRLWEMSFSRLQFVDGLPYPGGVVEEIEGEGYRMPPFSNVDIPTDVGGQITLTLSGKGCLKVGKKVYELGPNTAFLYRDCDKQVSCYCPVNATRKWHFIWINFVGAESAKLIGTMNQQYGYVFNLLGDDTLKEELLAYKKFAGKMLSLTPLNAAKIVFNLLEILCRAKAHSMLMNRKNTLVSQVQQEITANFCETISTGALAQKLGISREALSKSFRKHTGVTIQDYRTEQRMARALSLLLKTNMSCKEIALHCNFGSYSSFFRNFKKIYNMTPEMFRMSCEHQ